VTPQQLGTIGVYVSAGISTAGFLGFALMARFWNSRGGWHVFWYMLMISWVLDLTTVAHLLGDSPWFAWLRAATFAIGMPLVLGWRSWLVFDLQLLHRYRRRKAYGEADSRPAGKEET
jgi:FtsH-binding integral membrane protein